MIDTLLNLILVATFSCSAAIIRNISVYSTCMTLLIEDYEAFARLPTYEAMIFKPCYWHLWTVEQWAEATK